MGVRATYRYAEFDSKMRGAIDAGLRDAAYEIERRAVGKAPFKTGNLRNSIGSEFEPGHAAVYADADYAYFVEEGHGSVPPTHFLQDSLEEVEPEIPEMIRRHT